MKNNKLIQNIIIFIAWIGILTWSIYPTILYGKSIEFSIPLLLSTFLLRAFIEVNFENIKLKQSIYVTVDFLSTIILLYLTFIHPIASISLIIIVFVLVKDILYYKKHNQFNSANNIKLKEYYFAIIFFIVIIILNTIWFFQNIDIFQKILNVFAIILSIIVLIIAFLNKKYFK